MGVRAGEVALVRFFAPSPREKPEFPMRQGSWRAPGALPRPCRRRGGAEPVEWNERQRAAAQRERRMPPYDAHYHKP